MTNSEFLDDLETRPANKWTEAETMRLWELCGYRIPHPAYINTRDVYFSTAESLHRRSAPPHDRTRKQTHERNTTMNTHIYLNTDVGTPEEGMLQTVLAKCARYVGSAHKIDIFINDRIPADAPAYKHPGWLEYRIVVYVTGNPPFVMGAIQRTLGAETEFHS